jgi:hypothetical protein
MALNSGDIEFYFSAEVMTIAKAFAPKLWEELDNTVKSPLITCAIMSIDRLLNDPVQAENIRTYLNLEFTRKAREYD